MTRHYVLRKPGYRVLATVLDGCGDLARRVVRPVQQEPFSAVKKILLVRLDHIGDILHSLGLPKILKEHNKRCRVVFLTSPAGAELLKGNPFVDEVLVHEASWFRRSVVRCADETGFLELAAQIKKRQIDLGFSLRGDLRENLLLSLGRVRMRIGYGITGGGFLLTREVPYKEGLHQSDRPLELLRAAGLKVGRVEPRIYIEEDEKKEIDARFSELGLTNERRYLGVQLRSGTSAKDWGGMNTKLFLDLWTRSHPEIPVVLVGASDTASPKDLLPEKGVIDLRGKTSLRELCHLSSYLFAFLGPDSGPAHLAAALGVRTVFLYSGTNPFEEWKPLEEEVRVLRHEVSCSPCGLSSCTVAGHPCMDAISPESTVKVLEQWL